MVSSNILAIYSATFSRNNLSILPTKPCVNLKITLLIFGEWWFKNGDRDGIFFAVSFEENNEIKPFYVDFIVLFKNKKIGLFGTKSGRTIKDSKEKSDGLQKYIINNKNIIGGIVTNTKPRDFSGRWVYF